MSEAIRVRTYLCNVRGQNWGQDIVSTSPGRAKAEYLLGVHECWEEVRFTDITCQVVGGPVTSDSFRRTAEYRGVPFARVGMKVLVGGHPGVIVGDNESANFNVLFTGGPWSGKTLNCHPNHEMEFPEVKSTEDSDDQYSRDMAVSIEK